MSKIERLTKYMELRGLNDNIVTKECSLSQGLIGQARKGKCDLGAKAIDKILKIYQDINRVWLLTGEGEMLKSNEAPEPTLQLSAKAEGLVEKLITSMEAAMASMQTTIDTQKQIIESQKAEIERLQRALEGRG